MLIYPYHAPMDTRNQVASLAERGATLQSIADAVGISKQRVHQMLKDTPAARRAWELKKMERALLKAETKIDQYKCRHAGRDRSQMEDPLVAEQVIRLSKKKSEAVRRGVEFTIGWADLEWPTHCPIFGCELNYFSDSTCDRLKAPSIDRVDPTKGYVPGNVAVISYRANRIKNDGTADDHRKIAEYIDKHGNYS